MRCLIGTAVLWLRPELEPSTTAWPKYRRKSAQVSSSRKGPWPFSVKVLAAPVVFAQQTNKEHLLKKRGRLAGNQKLSQRVGPQPGRAENPRSAVLAQGCSSGTFAVQLGKRANIGGLHRNSVCAETIGPHAEIQGGCVHLWTRAEQNWSGPWGCVLVVKVMGSTWV